jgi:ribonuclease P protein component
MAAEAGPEGLGIGAPRVPETLQKRSEFLAAAKGLRWAAPSLNLQARRRAPGETAHDRPRIGYTCSKKVGNAVARNRAKRRLRAAAAAVLPHGARAGWDYVLIGRAEATAARPFPLLVADLEASLARVHAWADA